MFEHFTFGAHAQTSFTSVEDTFPSPTDCSFALESPPPTSCCNVESSKGAINDIVNQLSSHSLHPDEDEQPQQSRWHHALLTPDFDNEMIDFSAEELSYTSTGRGKVTIPHSSLPNISSIPNSRTSTVACRRLQRQLNVQLQSCNTHIKDISTLVSEMITSSTQCRLHPPSTNTPFITEPLELDADEEEPSPPLHEDEGFAEMEDDEMTLRRASTPSGIRKWNVRFRANGDCVGGPPELAWMGRRKVRCVPRMRRRKPKTDTAVVTE